MFESSPRSTRWARLGVLVLLAGAACDTATADTPKTAAAEPAKPEAPKPEAAKPEAAKPEAPQPEAAKPASGEIDVDSLLEGKDSAHGLLSQDQVVGIDASQAPRLGSTTADSHPAIKEAEWLVLPGDQLEIPNPPGWMKKKDGNVGLLVSPDEKAAIIFTTYASQQEVVQKLDEIGRLVKITSVAWKDPQVVQLGQDSLPALVRAGKATLADGKEGGILFALVETGVPDKVLAVALKDADASVETMKQAEAVMVSTRKRR
jgi:hypothetical protein